MEATATPRRSILGLIHTLKDETRQLLRQEIQLVKAELSEKLSLVGRNAATAAAGGFIAYAGLIVFFMGLGWLVAWGLQKAGLEPVLAGFLGLAIIGVVVGGIGTVLLFKGLKSFSQESLAPQRTIHTLQRLKGNEHEVAAAAAKADREPKRSSEEMQARVEATENRMNDTLDELGYRLSPGQIKARMTQRIQERPYRSGLVAVVAGAVSGFFLTRAARRS
jgi:hypothetical protein